jgi:FixJ family two-component response regulator
MELEEKTMSLSCTVGHQLGAPTFSAPKPIVFVVDDDVSVRESLSLLLSNEGWQPETFASAQEFLDRPPATVPNCLVLDIVLPGINGLDLQKRIIGQRTVTPIIFITGHGDVPKSVQAMKAGAFEFLTKPLNDEMLLTAVRHALKKSQNAAVFKAEVDRLRACYALLTRREEQVMELVVLGRQNKEIADELHISEVTVKAHRGRVMQKMEAGSLAELVMMAGKLRLGAGAHTGRIDRIAPRQQFQVA